MMRASLNFTLPQDQAAFNAALLGRRAIESLQNIDNHLRSRMKHDAATTETAALADEIRGMIDGTFLEIDA